MRRARRSGKARPRYKLADLLAESRADLDRRADAVIQAWMAMPDVGREKVDEHAAKPRNFAEALARIPDAGIDDDFSR